MQSYEVYIVESTKVNYKPTVIFTRIIYITICRRTLPYRTHIAIYGMESICAVRSKIRLSYDLIVGRNIRAQCQVSTRHTKHLNSARINRSVISTDACCSNLVGYIGITAHVTRSSRSDFIRNRCFHCISLLIFRSSCQSDTCTADKSLRVRCCKSDRSQNRSA